MLATINEMAESSIPRLKPAITINPSPIGDMLIAIR
jgi:hypothetical protein